MSPPILCEVSDRHFVKYTFLKVDPAWRRLDAHSRARDKQEFLAACEDFGTDHLLQAFSLVGTRGDAEIMLVAEAELRKLLGAPKERTKPFHEGATGDYFSVWTWAGADADMVAER